MAQPSSLLPRFRRFAQVVLEECRKHQGEDLVSVAIFGSVARGTATAESDLDLASSYMKKALARLAVLDLLLREEDYSDVLRRAQETVELATKAMLRKAGIDPSKWHDVGGIILQHRERFPAACQGKLEEIARISKALRKERELSFYGDIHFIPSEEYTRPQAEKAAAETKWVGEAAGQVVDFAVSSPPAA